MLMFPFGKHLWNNATDNATLIHYHIGHNAHNAISSTTINQFYFVFGKYTSDFFCRLCIQNIASQLRPAKDSHIVNLAHCCMFEPQKENKLNKQQKKQKKTKKRTTKDKA